MAAYSMDLRLRVLRDSDAGMPSQDVAEKYAVSRAWVDRLKQRRRETGEITPRRQTRWRTPILHAQLDQLARPPVVPPEIQPRPESHRARVREAQGDSAKGALSHTRGAVGHDRRHGAPVSAGRVPQLLSALRLLGGYGLMKSALEWPETS